MANWRQWTILSNGYKPVSRNSGQHEHEDDPPEEVKGTFYHRREEKTRTVLYSVVVVLFGCFIAIAVLITKIRNLSASLEACAPDYTHFRTPLGRDMRYMSRDHALDFLWDPMLADGLGTFSTPGEDFETAEYSMFHQLRCLARFRVAIQRASEGEDVGLDFRDDHWGHCLDYMRRVVLCHADDTIERPRISFEKSDGTIYHGIEGAEDFRTCRSIKPMCRVLEERGVSNASCLASLDPSLDPWPGVS